MVAPPRPVPLSVRPCLALSTCARKAWTTSSAPAWPVLDLLDVPHTLAARWRKDNPCMSYRDLRDFMAQLKPLATGAAVSAAGIPYLK